MASKSQKKNVDPDIAQSKKDIQMVLGNIARKMKSSKSDSAKPKKQSKKTDSKEKTNKTKKSSKPALNPAKKLSTTIKESTSPNASNEDTKPLEMSIFDSATPQPRDVIEIRPIEPQHGIPSFDLAEEIMAKKRKEIAVRRTAPSMKNTSVKETTQSRNPSSPVHILFYKKHESNRIISDIVARHIKELSSQA